MSMGSNIELVYLILLSYSAMVQCIRYCAPFVEHLNLMSVNYTKLLSKVPQNATSVGGHSVLP